ncbi:HNH endonuclease [Streptomyces sp. NPDC003393]
MGGRAYVNERLEQAEGRYSRERLARAVAEARNWADLLRQLGLPGSGGQRRVLQEKVAAHGIDTSHFVKRSPWRKYGQPITLQIDHVNGDWRDNRRENLRYLCPNCHSLTETWCRQKGRRPLAA